MIGIVGSILGAAAINIDNMGVGRPPSNDSALMVIAIPEPCPADGCRELRAADGVLSVDVINLDR